MLPRIAWENKGDFDRAVADYTETIRLDPMDPVAHYTRGNAWIDKNDLDRAIALEETLAAAGEGEHSIDFYAAQWHLLHGNRADAVKVLRAAVDTCPEMSPEYEVAVAELGRLGA